MRKIVVIFFFLIAVDAICPDVDTGAQLAIAPAIIAAIISAVGSAAAAEKAKQGAQAAGASQAAAGEGGGFNMEGTLEDVKESFKSGEKAAPVEAMTTGPMPQQTKINADITQADGGAPPVTIGQNDAATGSITGTSGQPPAGPPPESIALPPPDGSVAPGTGPLPQGPPAEDGGKMSMEAKMAIAAQMGSMLRGPGAPRPPSTPSGPGINMQPTTLDDIYGRR